MFFVGFASLRQFQTTPGQKRTVQNLDSIIVPVVTATILYYEMTNTCNFGMRCPGRKEKLFDDQVMQVRLLFISLKARPLERNRFS